MSSHILVDYSPLTTLEVTQSRKMSPFKDEETRNQRYKSSLKITQPGRGKNKTRVSRHHSRPVYIVFIYRPGDSLNQWGILNGCQSAEDIVLRYYHLSRLLTYTTEAPAQSLVTLERRLWPLPPNSLLDSTSVKEWEEKYITLLRSWVETVGAVFQRDTLGRHQR